MTVSLSVQYQIFTQVIVMMCVVFVIDQTHVHTNDCLSLSVQYQIFTQVIVLMCVVFVIDQTHVHTNDCLFISTVSDLHSGYSADVCSVCYRSDTRSH